MPLTPGTRLGHYDITSLLGEGGMGQVWQATDTQLNRQVALKILPDAFASDPDRLARFTREAQILASLNHPNIAAIHGIEESEPSTMDGTSSGQQVKALVLELVEGPTLADRIARGAIPTEDALPIAKQIAEALEGAQGPFLSPDGQSVAFTADSAIKRVPLSGGEVFTVCDRCFGGYWGDDEYIYYDSDGGLFRILAVGGTPELLAEPKPDRGVPRLTSPAPLPGGRAVLFEIGNFEFGGIGVLSLETDEMIVVSEEGSDPFYSPTGHILFARGSTLFAVPFDVDNFRTVGPAAQVTRNVQVENGGAIQAALSRDGLFVYKPAGEVGTQLVWADRSGTIESMIEDWRVFTGPQLSPDGEQLAVQINEDGGSAIWIREVESGSLRLLTLTENATAPVWSPDGGRVAFGAGSGGAYAIHSIAADGAGPVETLLESEFPVVPNAWSPDGNQLVFREDSPNRNLFVAEIGNDGSRRALLDAEFTRHSATLSPSGTWLAYVSNRSGSDEVYVVSFPDPGAERVISSGGGSEPVWGADERELFYRGTNGLTQMVTSLQLEPFRVLSREPLFETPDFWGMVMGRAQYDFHSDDQRFLMLNMRGTDGDRAQIHLVQNWFDELKRLVPMP